MARSNAEKKRRKLEREGFRNPEKSRVTNEKMVDISLHVRVKNGKDEYSRRVKHKKHVRNQCDGDAFYLYQAKIAL